MEVDGLLQNIDFSNKEHRRRIEDVIDKELQQLMSEYDNIANIHEKLLVSAQKQVIPFINAILDFKSFHEFADLKNAVDYIAACQQENRVPPFPDIEDYEELCYNTAFIFDTDMEDECDESEIKKYNRLRDAYYREISQKDTETQIIAEYFWLPLFSEYYYFLGYFNAESNDKESDKNICRKLIMDILDVIWRLDKQCKHTMEDSYFKKAVTTLFAYEE